MSTPLIESPITTIELLNPINRQRKDKRDSSGRKLVFIPNPEFIAEFVEWRQSRMENLPSKCAFDRWYEALLKEHIWHHWMINGFVKSMDIPTRNTLAHLYVNATTPETEKRVGSAKRGLLVLHNNAGKLSQSFEIL
jgi:hypothetical protein